MHSDLHGSPAEREIVDLIGRKLNTSKIGFYANIGTSYKIWKWVSIEGNLTYQERWPLEVFNFDGDRSFAVNTLYLWPTSPQSNLWDPDIYSRFPNFKYLHLDVIPMVSFGKKLNLSVGIGIFYGRLLNKNKLVFSRKDFPASDYFFEEPFNASGEIRYTANDVGWIPTFSMNYPVCNRLRLGISMKAYVSEYALREKRSYPSAWGRTYNATWMVFTGGVEVRYVLGGKDIQKK